jgi:hypothetical protein
MKDLAVDGMFDVGMNIEADAFGMELYALNRLEIASEFSGLNVDITLYVYAVMTHVKTKRRHRKASIVRNATMSVHIKAD